MSSNEQSEHTESRSFRERYQSADPRPVHTAELLTEPERQDIRDALLTLMEKCVEETVDEEGKVDGYIINDPRPWEFHKFLETVMRVTDTCRDRQVARCNSALDTVHVRV